MSMCRTRVHFHRDKALIYCDEDITHRKIFIIQVVCGTMHDLTAQISQVRYIPAGIFLKKKDSRKDFHGIFAHRRDDAVRD